MAGSTMPVPRSRWDCDHIACCNGFFLSVSGNDSQALDDVQYLVLFMDMWPGTCARAKVDVQQIKLIALCRAYKYMGVYFAIEVVGTCRIMLCLSPIDSGDLHCYLRKSIYYHALQILADTAECLPDTRAQTLRDGRTQDC